MQFAFLVAFQFLSCNVLNLHKDFMSFIVTSISNCIAALINWNNYKNSKLKRVSLLLNTINGYFYVEEVINLDLNLSS